MIDIDIPGREKMQVAHLVLDFNGTIAVDGRLVPGVGDMLNQLGEHLEVHVITADTFGRCRSELTGVRCRVAVLPEGRQDDRKWEYIQTLGAHRTVAAGNGLNDRRMLKAAALGIAVMLDEGLAVETLMAADIVCPGILPALELLTHPLRLKATLRT